MGVATGMVHETLVKLMVRWAAVTVSLVGWGAAVWYLLG